MHYLIVENIGCLGVSYVTTWARMWVGSSLFLRKSGKSHDNEKAYGISYITG